MSNLNYGLPRAIGRSLQDKPRYWGTASPDEIDRRRAKNKQARKSRRKNRK